MKFNSNDPNRRTQEEEIFHDSNGIIIYKLSLYK
jgi:hypothetical protein